MSDKEPIEILRTLPVIVKTPCINCGAHDWTSANQNSDGEIHQCNKCHEDGGEKLVRKNLQ